MLAVPLDYTRPAAGTISIAVSRLPATDPAHRRGVLVTTGGGPGEPGVPLPDQLAHTLDPAVVADYDLVGFDPRFVERSTPITCGQPGEEPGGYWVRTQTYQTFAATAVQARRYAQDCVRNAGWALPYATTANVARDMDRIRAALGEDRISYLAGSSAATVGALYAALYPGRVDRFVLDSPPAPGQIWRPYELDRAAALEAGYGAFTTWLAGNDAGYHLGSTPPAVRAALRGLLDRAYAAPIPAGGHAWTGAELGYLALLATLFEQLWPVVALDLAAIGAGAAPPVPVEIRPVSPAGVPADNHTAANLAYRCADRSWPHSPTRYVRDLAGYGERFPVYGPAVANINPCAFWPPRPDTTVPTATDRTAGVLVIAATRDASVPIANARAVAQAIRGSRLVSVDAQVHVPLLSGYPAACLQPTVTGYLLTGALPATDLSC
jgi:pimeloyl-ACP methyl ester carboxylesterase